MAFTIGTADFTNGSTAVTNIVLSSGTLSGFSSGTRVIVGADPVKAEVEALSSGVDTMTLRNNWTHGTGNYAFLANQTSNGLRDAVQLLRDLVNDIGNISTTALADTTAKRDGNARLEAAAGVSGDDVLTWQNLTSSPTATSGVMQVGDGGLNSSAISITDWDDAELNGFYKSESVSGQSNSPNDAAGGWQGYVSRLDNANIKQMVWQAGGSFGKVYFREGSGSPLVWSEWHEYLHSGNLNSNVFGGLINSLNVVATGVALSTSVAWLYLPLNSITMPLSLSVSGTFQLTARGTAVRATGVASNFFLKGESSQKVAVIELQGLSGLEPNENLELAAETLSSKITVNF